MNHWQNFYHDATAQELDAAATIIGLIGFESFPDESNGKTTDK